MIIPDVRYSEGYDKLKHMLDSLMNQLNLKQLEEMTKALFTDLRYYHEMAEYHAPLGLSDDARRVRRLESEIKKIREVIDEFSSLSLCEDGSIIVKDSTNIENLEAIFNKFEFGNQITIEDNSLERRVEDLYSRIEDSKNSSRTSLITQILIGLLTNLIWSHIQPTSPQSITNIMNISNHTINHTTNQVINQTTNKVVEYNIEIDQNNWILCNDLKIQQEPSIESNVIMEISGLRQLKIIGSQQEWFLIEFLEGRDKKTGWVRYL